MDTTAAWRELLELAGEVERAEDQAGALGTDPREELGEKASRMAELIRGLDDAIGRLGMFLPEQLRRRPTELHGRTVAILGGRSAEVGVCHVWAGGDSIAVHDLRKIVTGEWAISSTPSARIQVDGPGVAYPRLEEVLATIEQRDKEIDEEGEG